ncbi:MAG: type II toxin-antitoxin system VapC family toxin [Bacteroidota bacterium]
MTGNKCLLDTSVIIDVFRNNNTVAARLDAMDEVYVPVEVIGELYYGAYRSADPLKHISRIRFFLLSCKVLSPDSSTSDTYGEIKSALMGKGKPIPENDIWIAALARQHNLPVFTADKHFSEVDHISLVI